MTGLTTQTIRMDHCADPIEFRGYWKRNYRPVIAAYRFNQDQLQRIADLDRDFFGFPSDWNQGDGQAAAWDAEYLLVTAVKR